jgi:putative membrane protein
MSRRRLSHLRRVRMSNIQSPVVEEARRTKRTASYGIIAILTAIGIGIGLSIYLRAAQPGPWSGYPFFGLGWIGIIFAFFFVFWILRWVFWSGRPYGYWLGGWNQSDANSILRERYARGEITREQFDQMTRDLRGHD